MATNLTMENVPEDILEHLRNQARRHHQSIEGEALAILEEALRPQRLTIEDVRERLNDLHPATSDESTRIVRADRDAG